MTKIAIENRWFRFYDFEISGHEQETENGSGTILQLPAAYVGIDVSSNGLSLQKIHQLYTSLPACFKASEITSLIGKFVERLRHMTWMDWKRSTHSLAGWLFL